jgi:tight adherence protein B
MTRPRTLLAALGAGLLVASPAAASVRLSGADSTQYPTVRVNVVTGRPSARAPRLYENGVPVAGQQSSNLGAQKSVVLAIDRSQSMAGASLRDAIAGARAFVAAKPSPDRIAVIAFGAKAVQLTGFSSSATDADNALRTLEVDRVPGTALNGAVRLASESLANEQSGGRVVILLTDGRNSSKTTQAEAVAAARLADVSVYPVAIEGPQFSPAALRALANATGGSYHGATSSAGLAAVYRQIAAELRRTWRVEYQSSAQPGTRVHLLAKVPGAGSGRLSAVLSGSTVAAPQEHASHLLPYGSSGPLVMGIAVGALIFLAVLLLMRAREGGWLAGRLQAHVGPRGDAKDATDGERLRFLRTVFRATESAFGHRSNWKRLGRMLERADLPLRTVEFVYICVGSGMAVGFLIALVGAAWIVILLGLAGGALIPLMVVSLKAKRRTNAFENLLPDLLITLAASLKAGHSFKQGIQSAVEEGQEPVSKELKRVLTETQLGRPMNLALAEAADRIGSKNFSFVITAVTIQTQVGGSLSNLFDMIADTVRQRQQFARKIKGLTAMGRAAAYVLVGLPFFIAGALTLMNPSYMAPLWSTPTGHMLIFLGLGMMAFGSLVLRKIVSFRG